MRVLVVNAGSSSLKLSVLDGDDVIAATDAGRSRDVRRVERADRRGRPPRRARRAPSSPRRSSSTTAWSASSLALTPLAPLHQPRAVQLIREARELLPDVPHVACFDTAFHTTMPAAAKTYALPKEWRDHWPRATVRLPRPLARVRVPYRGRTPRPTARRAADGHLPPRRGRVAVRGARRRSRRHDDGDDAARRARHGDPRRQHRPRSRRLGAAVRRPLARRGAAHPRRGVGPQGAVRFGRHARRASPRAAHGDDVGRRSRSTSTSTNSGARSARWPRASVVSTPSCSPGEWASTHPKSATRRPHRSPVSRCSSSKPTKTSRSRRGCQAGADQVRISPLPAVMTVPGMTRRRQGVSFNAANVSAVGVVQTAMMLGS